jgi:hypothetical protein
MRGWTLRARLYGFTDDDLDKATAAMRRRGNQRVVHA